MVLLKRILFAVAFCILSAAHPTTANAACCQSDWGGCPNFAGSVTSTTFDRTARTCEATAAASGPCVNQLHRIYAGCRVSADCANYTVTIDITCMSYFKSGTEDDAYLDCADSNAGTLCGQCAVACAVSAPPRPMLGSFLGDTSTQDVAAVEAPSTCLSRCSGAVAAPADVAACHARCDGRWQWCPGFSNDGNGAPLHCPAATVVTESCGVEVPGSCVPDPTDPTKGTRTISNNCCSRTEPCCDNPLAGTECTGNGVNCRGVYNCAGVCVNAPASPTTAIACPGNGINCPGVEDCNGNCINALSTPSPDIACPGNGPQCPGVEDCAGNCINALPAPVPDIPCPGNGVNCPGILDCLGNCVNAPLTPPTVLSCPGNGIHCPGIQDCAGTCINAPSEPSPERPCPGNGTNCPGKEDCNGACTGALAAPDPAIPCPGNGVNCPGSEDCAGNCTGAPATPPTPIVCDGNGPFCKGVENCVGGCVGAPLTPTPAVQCGTAPNCLGNRDCAGTCNAPLTPTPAIPCSVGTGCTATPGCTTDGNQRCDGSCDAASPISPLVESCNGLDDNCDCLVDEGGVCSCEWGFYDDGVKHKERAGMFLDQEIR